MKKITILFLFLTMSKFSFADNPEWIVFNYKNSELTSDRIYDISFDGDNNAWLAVSDGKYYQTGSLVFFDRTNFTVWDKEKTGLKKNLLLAIEIDRSNNIWLGSAFGLLKYNHNDFTIYDTNNSPLPGNLVHSLAVDSLNVKWILSYRIEQGDNILVTLVDGNWQIFDSSDTEFLNNIDPYSIFVDKHNNKWIGLSNENIVIRYNDNEWIAYDTIKKKWTIEGFAEDSLGNIWVCGDYPVKFDGENWTFYSNCPKRDVKSIAVENKDLIWVGCNANALGEEPYHLGGLLKFEDDRWTVYTTHNSPLPMNPQVIKIDKYGNKWLVTGGGLAIYKEGGVVNITDVEDDRKVERNKILCYPNPASGSVNVRYRVESAGEARIFLIDALGRKRTLSPAEYKFPGDYVETFDLSALPQGTYIVVLQAGSRTYTEKLVIAR